MHLLSQALPRRPPGGGVRGQARPPPETGLTDLNCPNCGNKGTFTEPKQFSGLLSTHLGPTQDSGSVAYLRPETAQGIFTNFAQVQTTSRRKPPFGIAQMGKSFRNEITPGNFIFRTREFEQMEMEFFVKPGEDEKWQEYWMQERWNWYTGLGLREENMRWYDHPAEKLSHYSKRTADIEYRFQFGGNEWGELEGVANRTDYDLSAHAKASGQDLPTSTRRPHERWTCMSSSPPPVSAARCWRSCWTPTSRTRPPTPRARWRSARCCASTRAWRRSRSPFFPCRGTPSSPRRPRVSPRRSASTGTSSSTTPAAIGRRYRRQDEIGTPFCVTVDFDTLDDNAVTVRERDTMKQERVSLDQIEGYLASRLIGC